MQSIAVEMHLPMVCGSTDSASCTASNTLATVVALLAQSLLLGAIATHHALRPLHFMPISALLMTQVTCKSAPTAWEA